MKDLEILAPVGNEAMLDAAISAGADSFYLATDDFGARAYAKNFDIDSIEKIIDKIHLLDKKVYITINTLIKDSEFQKCYSYAKKLYEYGADGFIIQDLGLYLFLKYRLTDIEYHASTQMAVRDYDGAKFLKELGFDRVVIARETSFEDIKKINELDIDLEIFVHGSLCVCISGECLMSSYLGRRSANRGKCAGPCRKRYKIKSPSGKIISTIDDYLLNMRDLCTIDKVKLYKNANIRSLKIEGRMKTAEYVYNVVKSYKYELEDIEYNKKNLIDVSNRGYTKGFIFNENKDYISLKNNKRKHRKVGSIVKKENTMNLFFTDYVKKGSILEIETVKGKKLPFTATKDFFKNEKITLYKYKDAKESSDVFMLNSSDTQLEQNSLKFPIDLYFKAKVGQKPSLNVRFKEFNITVQSDKICEKAKNISVSKEDIKKNVNKLNDTFYFAKEIFVDITDDIFIRKKEINKLRRDIIALLNEKRLATYKNREIKDKKSNLNYKEYSLREKNIEINSIEGIENIDISKFDNIYIRKWDQYFKCHNNLYYIIEREEIKIEELINFLIIKKFKGVYINNYSYLRYYRKFIEKGLKIRIGNKLNVFNEKSANYFSKFCEMIHLSVENDFSAINNLSKKFNVEVTAFGKIELMTMIHCPFSAIKKCGLRGCENCKYREGYKIINDKNREFDVFRYEGYSKIYSDKYLNVDTQKLNDNLSLLYIYDGKNFVDDTRKIDNLNYERGVN
ncbi:MAG: U32 family peptidase [Tissierellia bacterium]|nr:U32 family peptidase [Tissierellia bacterium]